ncbi:hypothetical protein BZG36_00651 [Bifiguratus adelaidae]|uniref:F-box domain-containing protein n=1 Tax=Bifiguratus adelaidae TaxID=1938954 RepID=A0A261Y6Y2_9FUNG|nr:hypothetical protein BZG36_00651 [Bifiguratus adelaidae]
MGSRPPTITTLPTETLSHVIYHLDLKTIVQLSSTCQFFHDYIFGSKARAVWCRRKCLSRRVCCCNTPAESSAANHGKVDGKHLSHGDHLAVSLDKPLLFEANASDVDSAVVSTFVSKLPRTHPSTIPAMALADLPKVTLSDVFLLFDASAYQLEYLEFGGQLDEETPDFWLRLLSDLLDYALALALSQQLNTMPPTMESWHLEREHHAAEVIGYLKRPSTPSKPQFSTYKAASESARMSLETPDRFAEWLLQNGFTTWLDDPPFPMLTRLLLSSSPTVLLPLRTLFLYFRGFDLERIHPLGNSVSIGVNGKSHTSTETSDAFDGYYPIYSPPAVNSETIYNVQEKLGALLEDEPVSTATILTIRDIRDHREGAWWENAADEEEGFTLPITVVTVKPHLM